MRSIGANQNDLEILIAKRYLLTFESGVIVIKHWKLHNCIRQDRKKPTMYQEEKGALFEKPNGAYTDKKPVNTLPGKSCQSNDNQMTTKCQHRLVKDSIDEVSIDQPAMCGSIEQAIKHWNSLSLPVCKYTTATIPDVADIRIKFDTFGYADIIKAIDNLSTAWPKIEPRYRPRNFQNFITRSLDGWLDTADPLSRYQPEKKESVYKPYVPEVVEITDEDRAAGEALLENESMADMMKRLAKAKNVRGKE